MPKFEWFIHETSISNFFDNCPIFVVHICCLKKADKHSSNEVRQPRFGIIDNFFSKKAKTLIIMINIANNSLVNTQNNIPKVYIVEQKLGHNGRLGNSIWSFKFGTHFNVLKLL